MLMVLDNLQLYYKLYDLSRQQCEEIEAGNIDAVLEIIDKKQTIFDQIEDVSIGEEIKNHRSPREIAGEIRELLKELEKLERENARKLKKLIEELEKRPL